MNAWGFMFFCFVSLKIRYGSCYFDKYNEYRRRYHQDFQDYKENRELMDDELGFLPDNSIIYRITNKVQSMEHKGSLRIKGENITDTSNYPYIVAILINGLLWCNGAVVDKLWVVTAAHCLNYVLNMAPLDHLGQYVKVRVGSTDANRGGQLVDVVGAVTHPMYEIEPSPRGDICLLKLTKKLVYDDFVQPIKLYQGDEDPFPQNVVLCSGWGATKKTSKMFKDHSPYMVSSRLTVRTQRFCSDSYDDMANLHITSDVFCASLRNGAKDVCAFDAGTPAVRKGELLGIMSFGPTTCGGPPPVFIRTSHFRDFINSTITTYKNNKALMNAMAVMRRHTEADRRRNSLEESNSVFSN